MLALTRSISRGTHGASPPANPELSKDTAIMYDPLNRTLFQGSRKALEGEHHIEIPIRNCRTKVDIKVPLRRTPSSPHGIYLATVDLKRLGKVVKNGVRDGKITNVYVLGYVPDRMMCDSGAEDTDDD